MRARARTCPVCDRPLEKAEPSARFCSPACKLVDLGRWLDGGYRIPGPPAELDGAREEDG